MAETPENQNETAQDAGTEAPEVVAHSAETEDAPGCWVHVAEY